ncbi:CASP-like protein 4A2 isoform X3 [Tupaia chinensis]|uniref:CASP-like protein 4A2 isoform X3 n=1 Tax=Tupaia chinensis TaxID=246437 RepID=UPI0007040403|nr:CASP-like protein 4A2 isoform X3 [Tupaia chinensis]
MPVSSGCIEASSCPLPGPRSKAVGTQLLCAASPGAAPLSVVPSAATGGSTEQPGPLGPLPGSFCRYRRCSRAGDTAEPGRWVRSPPGSRQRSRAQVLPEQAWSEQSPPRPAAGAVPQLAAPRGKNPARPSEREPPAWGPLLR